MGFLKKLFTKKTDPVALPDEQAVIVHFNYASDDDLQPLFDFEDELTAVLESAQVGDLDGHDIAVDGSHGFLYMYGPDADRLFETIRPILEKNTNPQCHKAIVRYGPPVDGVEEREVVIGAVH